MRTSALTLLTVLLVFPLGCGEPAGADNAVQGGLGPKSPKTIPKTNTIKPVEPNKIVAPNMVADPDKIVAPNMVADPDKIVAPNMVADPDKIVAPNMVAGPDLIVAPDMVVKPNGVEKPGPGPKPLPK